jgi:hypothetical protein
MKTEPQQQHRWLEKLVGEWTYTSECDMGPDQPPMKVNGSERVRSVGGLWAVAEGAGGSGDDAWTSVMTLGFDPRTGRFVGTFIASMMTHLWVYDGTLDESTDTLTLDAEGPDFSGEGMAKYQDIVAFVGDDQRTLTSRLLGPDGQWHQFMQAHYHRAR